MNVCNDDLLVVIRENSRLDCYTNKKTILKKSFIQSIINFKFK